MSKNGLIPGKLSQRQLALIFYLCRGASVLDGARSAGVAPSTARRWLADAAFQDVFASSKTKIFDEALGQLRTSALVAAQGLINLLGSKNESVRRLTASMILDLNFKIRDSENLEARIAALEAIVKANPSRLK